MRIMYTHSYARIYKLDDKFEIEFRILQLKNCTSLALHRYLLLFYFDCPEYAKMIFLKLGRLMKSTRIVNKIFDRFVYTIII